MRVTSNFDICHLLATIWPTASVSTDSVELVRSSTEIGLLCTIKNFILLVDICHIHRHLRRCRRTNDFFWEIDENRKICSDANSAVRGLINDRRIVLYDVQMMGTWTGIYIVVDATHFFYNLETRISNLSRLIHVGFSWFLYHNLVRCIPTCCQKSFHGDRFREKIAEKVQSRVATHGTRLRN